ncbi:MAG: hypothetical protein O3B72_09245, partial [Proteobacteria bacterium]|nr:hypothetical protein [Pseudomonadota bacterium]
LVLGAFSQGVERIYLAREPFRINEKAVENLPERDKVEILQFPLTHRAEDTRTMARLMWEAGCRVFIVLGGDGTSRIVAGPCPDAIILPLSTGTNNVFPYRIEATVAGMAAGLVAAGRVSADHCLRCKRVHVQQGDIADIALIDAVMLHDDFIGSLMPFDADKLGKIVLTRAEPASIGISPIGGFMVPTGHHDDRGVVAECGPDADNWINVPLSPGLHADVGIHAVQPLALGEPVTFEGPGILAFDGDRTLKLQAGETATATVLRDGPFIIEAERVMAVAAEAQLFDKPYKSS